MFIKKKLDDLQRTRRGRIVQYLKEYKIADQEIAKFVSKTNNLKRVQIFVNDNHVEFFSFVPSRSGLSKLVLLNNFGSNFTCIRIQKESPNYVLPQEKPGEVMKGGPFLHPKVVVLNQCLN